MIKVKMINIRRYYREAQHQLSNNKALLEQREKFDYNNLSLQALLYEKHHLDKEITSCKEYQTPNLAKAIDQTSYERVKSLDTEIDDETHQRILEIENSELNTRKNKYDFYQNTKKHYTHKATLLDKRVKKIEDFTKTFKSLESVGSEMKE